MTDAAKRTKVCSGGPISARPRAMPIAPRWDGARSLNTDPRVPWRRADGKIVAGEDIPHLPAALIHKHVADLRLLGLV